MTRNEATPTTRNMENRFRSQSSTWMACLATALVVAAPSMAAAQQGCDRVEVWNWHFGEHPGDPEAEAHQVELNVAFMEIENNLLRQIGVDFDFNIDDAVCDLDDSDPNIEFPNPGVTQPPPNVFTVPPIIPLPETAETAFGVAFLSDIESFLFLQAIQGDADTVVLHPPMVTLFNGAVANIPSPALQPVAGNQFVLPGIQLTVRGVVSADRRYVRLELAPAFLGTVPTDTYSTLGGQRDNSPGNLMRIEQPELQVARVATTVSVPDGGTVLLGGIKRLSQPSDSDIPPLLSKIPYFQNSGLNTGRATTTLMMMVTPRIIIQDE